MLCAIAILIYATAVVSLATDGNEVAGNLTVDIIAGNETIAYSDPVNPIIVSIPVLSVGNPNGYVAVIKDEIGDSILPFSIYRNGELIFVTPRTGTYEVFNNAIPFTDTTGHWAENHITFASARGLFRGVSSDLFDPNAPMTRAMFVQVLSRIEGENLSAYITSRFTDVPDNRWYTAAVEWAAESGLVSGVGSGRFDPEANITREQMARMLVRYMEHRQFPLTSNNASAFYDEADISAWALDSVSALNHAGILRGKPGNLFDPQGLATRAEVASVFVRFINAYVDHNNNL